MLKVVLLLCRIGDINSMSKGNVLAKKQVQLVSCTAELELPSKGRMIKMLALSTLKGESVLCLSQPRSSSGAASFDHMRSSFVL